MVIRLCVVFTFFLVAQHCICAFDFINKTSGSIWVGAQPNGSVPLRFYELKAGNVFKIMYKHIFIWAGGKFLMRYALPIEAPVCLKKGFCGAYLFGYINKKLRVLNKEKYSCVYSVGPQLRKVILRKHGVCGLKALNLAFAQAKRGF